MNRFRLSIAAASVVLGLSAYAADRVQAGACCEFEEYGGYEHGHYVELRFTLGSGCYATRILDEVCKDGLEEGLKEEQAPEEA